MWQRDLGEHAHGLGDTMLTLERAWGIGEASALGLEFGVKLPTAKDAIGSGKADDAVNPSKFLTIDFGMARATRPSPATTSLFAGVVFPLAKLW